jgi:cytoskeletal protein RodZ
MLGHKASIKEDQAGSVRGFDDFETSLGDVLRGERATQGKSLIDVQRSIRIRAEFLGAIENADLSVFESTGFVAGYVRSYARHLDVDPDWAFQKFCEETGFKGVHQVVGAQKSKRVEAAKPAPVAANSGSLFENARSPYMPPNDSIWDRMEAGAIASVAVLAVLIAGLGYGGWKVLQQVQRVAVVPVDQAPLVAAEVDPLESALTERDAAQGLATPEALDRLYRPAALDVPVMVSRDGPIAALDPNSIGSLVAPSAPEAPVMVESTPAAETSPQVVAADVAEVELVAVNPSWVRVTGADGSVLFEKVLAAGERYTLPKTETPPALRAGNAGSLYFMVNGEAYGPAGPGATVAKNVVLAAASLQDVYLPVDMTNVDIDPEVIRNLRGDGALAQ